MSPAELVERSRAAGLDRIAVTDHDALEGALRARELAPGRVIVGEEVSCRGGAELIGLFLEERVPPGLAVDEAAARIREQGGVVYAPHPFAYLVATGRRARAVLSAADALETVNARAFWPGWNRRAREAAGSRGLPGLAGSDAHFPAEVGRAFTRMPAFGGAAEFRASLGEAEPVLRVSTSPAYHVASVTLRGLRWITPGRRGSKGPRPAGAGRPLRGPASPAGRS